MSDDDEMMDSKPAAVDIPRDPPVDDQDDNLVGLKEEEPPQDDINSDNNMAEEDEVTDIPTEPELPPNVEDFVEDPAEEAAYDEADGYYDGDIPTEDSTEGMMKPAPVYDYYDEASEEPALPRLKDPPPSQPEMADDNAEEMMKPAPVYDEEPALPRLKDPPASADIPAEDSAEGMMKPAAVYDVANEEFAEEENDQEYYEGMMNQVPLYDMPEEPEAEEPELEDEGMMKQAPVYETFSDEQSGPEDEDMMKQTTVYETFSDEPGMEDDYGPEDEGMTEQAPVYDVAPEGPEVEDDGRITKPAPVLDIIALQEAMLAGKSEEAAIPDVAHPQGELKPSPDSDAAAKEEAMKGRNPEAASMPGAARSRPGQSSRAVAASKEGGGNDNFAAQMDGIGNPDVNPEELKNQKKEGSKREINPEYQDLQKTGKWGTISKVEMYGVAVIAVIIVIIVAVVLGVVLSGDNTTIETVLPATAAPTPMPTPMPPEEKLPILLEALDDNSATYLLFANETMPDIPFFYSGKLDAGGCDQIPHQCAMSWSLFEDEFPPATDDIVHRFSLAAFYYSMGGDNWANHTNWLTESSYCDWHGIKCNRGETMIEEMMLDDNDLDGKVPLGLALLDTLSVVSLKGNAIGGHLPGDVFAGMPELFLLYLQDNLFTGPIPSNLHDNGSLDMLFIQENNFTGPYPYCTETPNGFEPIFSEFGADCASKNPCAPGCCVSTNCY